jgi:hypothetical protein
MAAINTAGEKLNQLCDLVDAHHVDQFKAARDAGDTAAQGRILASAAASWHNDARRDFQVALMKLRRAVAQPTTF